MNYFGLYVSVNYDGVRCDSSVIDYPLNPESICIDKRAFAYYVYRKARKAMKGHAAFENSTIFSIRDGIVGIELYRLERLVIDGKKVVHFIAID